MFDADVQSRKHLAKPIVITKHLLLIVDYIFWWLKLSGSNTYVNKCSNVTAVKSQVTLERMIWSVRLRFRS